MGRFISIVFLTFVAITSIVFFLMAVLIKALTFAFDRRLVALHQFTCFWASIYTWVMPFWPIKITGKENIKRNKTYMIISNHQSQLDILVMFRLFVHYKWVSKVEIFKVPLIGWNMTLNRYIELKRGDKASIEKMMQDCSRTLQEGSSIFMFPEGTRSETGYLRPFKLGAFTLAKENKVPILPIVVNGTMVALPKYTMKYQGRYHISVRVLPEIPYESFKDTPAEELAEQMRQHIDKYVTH